MHREPAEYPGGGMGAMDHDMSDPVMAAAMERDMRDRFRIALVLTIAVIVFAPLGYNTFAIRPVHSQTAYFLEIRGQYDPCSSCVRAMQEAATTSGATIRYWWPGGSVTFP